MEDINEKELAQISALSDKLLEVVMNAEMGNPQFAIAALSHVAGLLAAELKMPEQVFLICMVGAYRAILEADKNQEVH
jgi:hypothetical protein